ncbi:Heat shock 70 kDa protein 12B [Apiospora arundinis]|uniref:Heat shock 70 kDa protein 12B n=1 Tax=Apiospora arundinis TaxID=335852 RepID=A0ABR2IB60_9PEZI
MNDIELSSVSPEGQGKGLSSLLSAKSGSQVTVVDLGHETAKCTRHYGFSVPELLNSETHGGINVAKPGMHRYVDKWDGQEYQNGVLRWQIVKGQEIGEGGCFDHSVSWTLDNCSGKRWDTATITVYACGHDVAPGCIGKDGKPYTSISRPLCVEHIGDVGVTLKGVNWGDIPRKYASDNRSIVYRFDATVRMGLADRGRLLTVKLLHGGQELGTADFKVQ